MYVIAGRPVLKHGPNTAARTRGVNAPGKPSHYTQGIRTHCNSTHDSSFSSLIKGMNNPKMTNPTHVASKIRINGSHTRAMASA